MKNGDPASLEKASMDPRNEREAQSHLLSPGGYSSDNRPSDASTDEDDFVPNDYHSKPKSFFERQRERFQRWRLTSCPSINFNLNRRQRMLLLAVAVALFIGLSYVVFRHSEWPVRKAKPPPSTPPPELEEPLDPEVPLRPQYCTTWPVDEDGKYKPQRNHVDKIKYDSIAPKGGWKKPTGFKIIAMVFYGRRRFIDILDCYLQRNLASNGGYVDEVWYMAHTTKEEDVSWLSSFVQKTEEY
ncbi:hypothetical protein LTS18_009203, partial [Coniosporium uncinatum]